MIKTIRRIVKCSSFKNTLWFASFTIDYSIYFRVIFFFLTKHAKVVVIHQRISLPVSIAVCRYYSLIQNQAGTYQWTIQSDGVSMFTVSHKNVYLLFSLFVMSPSMHLLPLPFSPNTAAKKEERDRDVSHYIIHKLCMKPVSMIVTLLYRACYST